MRCDERGGEGMTILRGEYHLSSTTHRGGGLGLTVSAVATKGAFSKSKKKFGNEFRM